MTRRATRKAEPLHPMAAASETGDVLTRLGLRAAAEGIPDDYPDAVLLRLVKAAIISRDTRSDAFANWNARPSRRNGTAAEAKALFLQAAGEHERIEAKILNLRAKSPQGAAAKLQYVLKCEEFERDLDGDIKGGTCMCMPLSAMRDALAMLGDSLEWWQQPAEEPPPRPVP